MITMKDIVREGYPTLTEHAVPVDVPPTKEDQDTLTEMLTFVKNSQDPEISETYELRPGVGIAAPQLGISKRMMAVHFEDLVGNSYSDGYYNPKIISHSVEQTYISTGEGCLSVDREVPGIVPRYMRITVKAINLTGEPVKLRLKGYAAVVFQHEIDHLNGIMFFDHINKQDPFKTPDGAKPCDIAD